MKPLSECPKTTLAAIRGVLTDIDDTLTTDGHLTAAAYGALERLRAAGLIVVPVTGRPAGWCDHIARMWPVSAVIGENGAFYFQYDHGARAMRRRYVEDAAAREAHRKRLAEIAAEILAAVPGAAVAADQHYRETDLAIDYCEDVPPLSLEAAERIAGLMRDAGLHAKVSSIHVNGWFGDYDKLTMTRQLFREQFATEPIHLPRLNAIHGALDSLARTIVRIQLRLIVSAPRRGDLVLGVVGAIACAGVSVVSEITGGVILHHA